MPKLLALGAFWLCLTLCGSVAAETAHRVKRGETLTEIAATYKVTVRSIMQANAISNANQIRVGQTLKIPAEPPKYFEYKIRNGDSLSEIATRNGLSLKELTAFNGIRNANRIRVGQVIRIPSADGVAPAEAESPYAALPDATLKALANTKVAPGQWKHIVIHHSGTKMGSATSMDRFHREERGMENGLAYHFVIGNGNGMGDGEIYIGERWKRQIQGGHLASFALNQVSIGICLVGDFEKNRPSAKQMEKLEALTAYLLDSTRLSPNAVTTHTVIHPKHTACPGRHFPLDALRRALQR